MAVDGTRAPGGLVAVHAHPDDETLATGALLATWAASGRPATVVTCTRGERGEVIGDALAHLEGDGPALAEHRTRELAAALAALGVTDHVFLDDLANPGERFEDSGMAWLGVGRAGAAADRPAGAFVDVDVETAATALADLLRDRRPDVVAGYEPGGGYGHPDHVHAHAVMQRAVELAAVPGEGRPGHQVPVVLWGALPEAGLRAAYAATAALAGPGLAPSDPEGPLPSAAVPDAAVTVRVDVAPVLDRVVAALAAHATQVQAVRAVDVPGVAAVLALSNDVLQPVLAHEGHRIAPGGRTGDVVWPRGVAVVA